MKLVLTEVETPNTVLDADSQFRLTKAICAFPDGVYKWSNDFENLVETSTNIARVKINEGDVTIQCLTRSSLESGKDDLANSIGALFELAGAKVDHSGSYPGWNPNPQSEILELAKKTYNFKTCISTREYSSVCRRFFLFVVYIILYKKCR